MVGAMRFVSFQGNGVFMLGNLGAERLFSFLGWSNWGNK